MSAVAMVKQSPASPPRADSHQLQDAFGHLMQHNTRSEHQANTYAMDNSPYMGSGAASFDTTPEPEIGQWYMDQFGNKAFRLYQDPNNLGVDMSFVSCIKSLAGGKAYTASRLMQFRMRMDSKSSILSTRECTTPMPFNSST